MSNKKQALGLPIGSVRAILAIMLTGAAIGATFYFGGSMPEGLSTLAGVTITFYFQRSRPKEANE
jgi:hypothetical protein